MVHRIMKVTDYNREQERKWREAVEKWDYTKGGFPSRAMYLFINQNTGDPKKTGYVGKTKRGAIWAKTKKEVIKKLKR